MRTLNPNTLERVENYITEYQKKNGKSPSYRQIMHGVGMSSLNLVQRYVLALEREGRIERTRIGNISVPPKLKPSGVAIAPLVGSIACGQPVDAVENIEESFALPRSIFGNGDLFMLRTFGDSMIDIGIKKDDLVVIRKQNTADDGEIVVAMINGETTLKRIFRRNGKVILHPENKEMKDIVVVKPTIVKICEELGLTINNLENTRSRRDYNCYQISYPLLFENDEIDPVIKAETVFIQECYPEEVKQADSLIGEWLKANGFTKQAEEYGLLSFDIHVQTMERTLVDKVFALCDYMLLDDMQKHSRHIYDIYQLLGRVELNEEFRALIHRVREDRKYHSLCVSAQNNADIPALLEQVIETECYKKDYEEHTRTMLYTPCNYEEAITGLKKIIDSGMFGKDEEYEKNTVHISVSSASKIASYKEYRIFAMPEHDKYGDYAYKIPNKFISINRSEKAIVFHLPKDYVVRLKNGRTNQTAELTVTEFVAEVAGKDESAYGMKIIRPSQTANGGNTPKKKKTDFNSK